MKINTLCLLAQHILSKEDTSGDLGIGGG